MQALIVKYLTPFLPESSRSKIFGIPLLLISEWVMPKLHVLHIMSTPGIEFIRYTFVMTADFEYLWTYLM